jgi:hypothetical protein
MTRIIEPKPGEEFRYFYVDRSSLGGCQLIIRVGGIHQYIGLKSPIFRKS